jgi:AcrR family transcriptional regulator
MPPTSLQQKKQQAVRDSLWESAMQLFSQKGFEETTVEEIAVAAGISRRSFFRYFDSKNDLMAHGITNYAETLMEVIQSFPRSMPLREVFRATVLTVATQTAAHPRTRKIMEIAAGSPAAREAQLSRMSQLQDQVAHAYATRSSKKDPLAPGVLAGLTLSVLSVTFRAWFQNGDQDIRITTQQVFKTLGNLLVE